MTAIRVREMSVALGVSDHVVSSSVTSLLESGYLSREPVATNGRPYGCYRCSSKLTDALEQDPVGLHERQKRCIESVLAIDIAVVGGRREKHPLKIASRLLVITLMLHADRCGVVRDLSKHDLSALTGMNIQRIKSQLKKLIKTKYIESVVPGVSGTRLLGVSKGAYLLRMSIGDNNVHRDGNCQLIISDRFSLICWAYKMSRSIDHEECAKQINSDEGYIVLDLLMSFAGGRFFELREFFCQSETNAVRRYLQMKLEEYAGIFLSKNDPEDIEKTSLINAELRERIRNEVIVEKNGHSKSGGFDPSGEQKDLMVDFLLSASVALAREYAATLPKFNKEPGCYFAVWRLNPSQIDTCA